MENYGIFGQLAVESHEENVATEANILEEIAAEEAYADALTIEADMNADLTAMTQAQVAADRLEAQVSHEDMLLAKPEQINVGCVALSQEALATTAMLLGADTKILAPAVSQEAAESNPVSAMQVSQEGAKDFLKKVVESIKAIFRKVMNSAKKLYVKLVVAMDGTAKKAQKLKKHIEKDLKGAKAEKSTFDEKTSAKMRKAVITSTISELPKPDAKKDPFAAIEEIVNAGNVLVEALDKLDGEGKTGADFDTAKSTLQDTYDKAVESAVAKLNQLPLSVAEDKTNYTSANDKAVLAVTSYSNTKIHAIEVYSEDAESPVKVKPKVLTVDTSSVDESKMAVDSLDTSKSGLDTIISQAKQFPKLKDSAMKFIEKSDKNLDKLAKSSSDSKVGYVINKLKAGNATLLRDLSVTSALNSVLDEVKSTKATFSNITKNVSMYSKSASKM